MVIGSRRRFSLEAEINCILLERLQMAPDSAQGLSL